MVQVTAVDQPHLTAFRMPDRFRHDITYFASNQNVPEHPLGEGEWWIDIAEAKEALDSGCFHVVSPLDSSMHAEIELSEEQEAWLTWVVENDVHRVRLE